MQRERHVELSNKEKNKERTCFLLIISASVSFLLVSWALLSFGFPYSSRQRNGQTNDRRPNKVKAVMECTDFCCFFRF
jgi:hypothetical protein